MQQEKRKVPKLSENLSTVEYSVLVADRAEDSDTTPDPQSEPEQEESVHVQTGENEDG